MRFAFIHAPRAPIDLRWQRREEVGLGNGRRQTARFMPEISIFASHRDASRMCLATDDAASVAVNQHESEERSGQNERSTTAD